MTKETALELIRSYTRCIRQNTAWMFYCSTEQQMVLRDAVEMFRRWKSEGSENKAMRWLGYIQGVCVMGRLFTLEEVKEHTRRGYI